MRVKQLQRFFKRRIASRKDIYNHYPQGFSALADIVSCADLDSTFLTSEEFIKQRSEFLSLRDDRRTHRYSQILHRTAGGAI